MPIKPHETPDRLKVLTADQLWEPLPEPVWVVKDCIREASICELIAFGGSAKTWLAVDCAISVAAGIPWVERFEVTQGRVLLVDYENGNYELRRRLQAVSRARGLGKVPNINAIITPPFYLQNDATEEVLLNLLAPYALVVVDTLRAASPGVDENDSNIRTGIDMLRRVAEQTNTAFLILAHAKKGANEKGFDPREAGRGSGAIYDAADNIFKVTYVKGRPQTVEQTKARMGKYIPTFEITVDDEDGGVKVNSYDLGGKPAEVDVEKRTTPGGGGIEHQVMNLVRTQPGVFSKSELEKHVRGVSSGMIRTTVARMLDTGELESRKHRLFPAAPQDEVYIDDILTELDG